MNKQGKELLKEIKSRIKDSHSSIPYIKAQIKKIEKAFAERIAEELATYSDPDEYFAVQYKARMERRMREAIFEEYSRWDGETHYYLIYKDGSCVCISDEDLISGDPMPKLTNIVYAHYQDGYDEMDTESGALHFYECDEVDYEAEDERKEAYENAIEIKYGTEFGKRLVARGYGRA